MKKNLLYSLLAAGAMLSGGITAYAVSEAAPQKVTRASLAEQSEWTIMPASGGSTSRLPNSSSTPFQAISFRLDGLEVDQTYKEKVTVTYAGETVPYSIYATSDDEDPDNKGWSIGTTPDYDGVIIRINHQVFTTPGELVIDMQPGAFDTMDGDTSPAFHYTYSFGQEVKKEIKVIKFNPEANGTVKYLEKVSILFDVELIGADQIFCDESKAESITLTKDGTTDAIKATGVAYDESAYVEGTLPYSVTFPKATEAGEYTMTVPAGFFWIAPDNTSKPADAIESGVITAKFTVDPSVKTPMQNYNVVTPEQAPKEIKSFDHVSIDFYDVKGIYMADDAKITLKKDGKESGYTGELTYDWEYGNMHTAKVSFYKNGEDATITEAGTYDLTIGAGAIRGDEEYNDEITLTFKVNPSLVKEYTWTATPENNGKADLPNPEQNYTQITIRLNDAQTVSYDEWEDPNHDPQYGTEIKSIIVTYDNDNIKAVQNANGTDEANIGWSLADNWEEPEAIIRINNKIFEKPGKLTIEIDRGMFTVDGSNPFPAIEYTCSFGEIAETKEYETQVSPDMSIDKEYLISDFEEFKIEFLNAKTAEPKTVKDYDDNDKPIMREDVNPHLAVASVVYYGDYTITKVEDAPHPTFIIKFTDLSKMDASMGGKINLSIDEGSFVLDGNQKSPVISQTWRLKRTKEIDKSWQPSPSGDIVNNGYGIFANFKFNGDETLSVTGYDKIVVKFNDTPLERIKEADADKDGVEGYWTEKNSDNALIFNMVTKQFMNKDLTGKITIEIPENVIYISGEPLGAISHTWNIVKPRDYTFKFTPGLTTEEESKDESKIVNVESLSEIIIEFPEAKTAELNNRFDINLRSNDYVAYGATAPEVEVIKDAPHPSFKLTFDPAPAVETQYRLVFYYGAFYIDNAHPSKTCTFVANLQKGSGVDGITADKDGKYSVVSLDGKVIFTNGSYDHMKALPKGIYIINGKKISIR